MNGYVNLDEVYCKIIDEAFLSPVELKKVPGSYLYMRALFLSNKPVYISTELTRAVSSITQMGDKYVLTATLVGSTVRLTVTTEDYVSVN